MYNPNKYTQRDNAKDNKTVIPMYNLLEYSNSYSEIPEIYDNSIEINHLEMIMVLLLIYLLIIIRVLCCLNLKQK